MGRQALRLQANCVNSKDIFILQLSRDTKIYLRSRRRRAHKSRRMFDCRAGLDSESKHAEAFKYLKKASQLAMITRTGISEVTAARSIVQYKEAGKGTPVDKSGAFERYKLAANFGDLPAIHRMARYYAEGMADIGISIDKAAAEYYISMGFKREASLGGQSHIALPDMSVKLFLSDFAATYP